MELKLEDILTIVRQAAKEAVEEAVEGHREEMQKDVQAIVEKVVRDNLHHVGLRPEDPVETQADLRWVREWRETVFAVRRKGLVTAVGVVVAGALGAIWLGIRTFMTSRS